MFPTIVVLLLAILSDTAIGLEEDNTIICLFDQENECERCSVRNSNLSHHTLFGRNLTVHFCSGEYTLDYMLTIANSHSVAVKGLPSRLTCNHLDTGLYIYEVTELVLQDVEIKSCSSVFVSPHDKMETSATRFISSIYILNCTNVTIARLTVTGSNGNGLSMFDNDGTVVIHDSHFKENIDNRSSHDLRAGGSGLHIVLSYCKPRSISEHYNCSATFGRDVNNSIYSIVNCTFSHNTGGDSSHNQDDNPFLEEPQLLATGFGRGGGLCIVLDKQCTSNSVEVADCIFLENSALWGGGLYIVVLENAQNNTITVKDSKFVNNSCLQLAGGGANIGFQVYHNNRPQGNWITFHHCRFANNKAVFGGGVSFYSSSSRYLPNTVTFQECTWSNNIAEIGAAVNISPQVWKAYVYDLKIRIIFRDCTFKYNYLSNLHQMDRNISYKKGRGTFSAVGYRIWFEGRNVFDHNNNSALYLTSTEIELCKDSNIVFTNNNGFDGGAIFMLGFSAIIVNDGVNATFVNNSAQSAGGAIYQHTYDTRDFFASQSCFIQYTGNTTTMEHRNILFLFRNNKAGHNGRNSKELGQYGHSIYATTVEPCYSSKGCVLGYFNKSFTCIGNFTFEEKLKYDISTAGKSIKLDCETSHVYVIPGKPTELPIRTLNDLSYEVASIYHVTVRNIKKSNVSIENPYTYLSDKLIKVKGHPGNKAYLTLEITGSRAITMQILLKIQQCPPGYVYNIDKRECECSTLTNKQFLGIRECDDIAYQAHLTQGYWLGYSGRPLSKRFRFGLEKYLLHATCPLGQCLNVNPENKQFRSLPSNTSISALDRAVCGKSRTGMLCSYCRKGYAPQYHHSTYACKEGVRSCKIGWLLYLVLDIIPVTIFFIVVMVFDIKFTDGAVSGFILFVQLSDTMLIRANGFIQLPNHVIIALDVYRFITRIFNLNFFAVDSLSFCLWEKASTLDLLAFKYITILYASTLVITIIGMFKYCSKRLNNMLLRVKGGVTSTKSTIIHGVSGFLVICYSECTRISLLLLTPVPLYAEGKKGNFIKYSAAFFNGELVFFHGKHLLYALPALVIVITLGILPPLMLIIYPLCYRVLTFLRIRDARVAKILCTCFPLEKLKPFFDSFQSSYKDEYRFFSGLYFLYRFTTLATSAYISHLQTYYIFVQVQLVVILTIHALCQPYKKKWHNVLDALLFMSLFIINTVTLSNFLLTLYTGLDSQKYINRASTVQVLLLYLPLIYITTYTIRMKYQAIKNNEIMSALCYKLKRQKKVPLDTGTNYQRFSRSFSLNAAENRLKDNIDF